MYALSIEEKVVHGARAWKQSFIQLNHKEKLFVFLSFLRGYFPLLQWLPKYPLRKGYRDILAGLSISFMVIPQAMAYAQIAGVNPSYGLFTSLFPPMIYFLFGSSKHLIVGPSAVLSLMTYSTTVSQGFQIGSHSYVAFVQSLAFFSGMCMILISAFQLSFITNLLAHPVVVGFTSASGILIAFSQLPTLLGIHIERSASFLVNVQHLLENIREVNFYTLAIGCFSMALIVIPRFSRYAKPLPTPLFLIIAFILLSYGVDFEGRFGISIIGHIPRGIQVPTLDAVLVPLPHVPSLILSSIAIAAVSVVEALSIARTFANRFQYELSEGAELMGLGLGNTIGSLFGAYPATGSFSRTAVNASVGAVSGFSNLIAACSVLITLLLLTPLFYYLPRCILAAIIIPSAIPLVDIKEAMYLWKASLLDLTVMLVTAITTVLLGIRIGIAGGTVLALVIYALRDGLPDDMIRMHHYSGANKEVAVVEYRLNRNMTFSNAAYLSTQLMRFRKWNEKESYSVYREHVRTEETVWEERYHMTLVSDWMPLPYDLKQSPLHHRIQAVIFDMSTVNAADATGIHKLHYLHGLLAEVGIDLYLCNVQRRLKLTLRGVFPDMMMEGPDDILQAVDTIRMKVDAADPSEREEEERIPLLPP